MGKYVTKVKLLENPYSKQVLESLATRIYLWANENDVDEEKMLVAGRTVYFLDAKDATFFKLSYLYNNGVKNEKNRSI